MKKTTLMATVVLTMLLAANCKKDESTPDSTDTTTTTTITSDDAADIIATTVGNNTYGYTESVSNAAQKTATVSSGNTACLYSLDTSFVKTNAATSAVTFSYNLNFKYQMYCQNAIPNNMTFSVTANGNTDMAALSTSGSASGTLNLAGIPSTYSVYTLSGTYNCSGSATSKLREKNTFSYTLSLSATNVSVSKTNYVLTGGSCAVTFTATAGGQAFSFSGTLTYVSATSATLVINGKTYNINLPTGTLN